MLKLEKEIQELQARINLLKEELAKKQNDASPLHKIVESLKDQTYIKVTSLRRITYFDICVNTAKAIFRPYDNVIEIEYMKKIVFDTEMTSVNSFDYHYNNSTADVSLIQCIKALPIQIDEDDSIVIITKEEFDAAEVHVKAVFELLNSQEFSKLKLQC